MGRQPGDVSEDFEEVLTKEEILDKGGRWISDEDYDLLDRTAREIKATTILEIGSFRGTSSMLFGQIVKENGGILYCVESMPKTEWTDNIKSAGLEDNVKLIKTYSPWVDIREIPTRLDYLFIDGDHRVMCAIADYHFWSPFVRVGGRIAFHDTVLVREGTGDMVAEAIEIIVRERDNIRLIGECTGQYGTKVFEKVGDFGD